MNSHEYRFVKSERMVTMRDVARAAKVALSTVSKALRNDPTIPEKRSLEIQALALRLGYRPNPMVSTLMAQLHHHRRRSDPLQIAWIDLWPGSSDTPGPVNVEPTLKGARLRARELGYEIEVYRPQLEKISPDRLRRILTARGQWGLIIPPTPEPAMHFALDLRGFTGVTIGTSLHQPVMHRVSPNHFQGGTLAFEKMRQAGFRRIGLVLSPAMNDRVEGKWLGAFLALQQALSPGQRVAPLIVPAEDRAAYRAWLRREKPDAILAAEQHVLDWLGGSSKPEAGWLMHFKNHHGIGSVDLRPEELGVVAVEMVVAQIHRNERGSPGIPHTILIEGVWMPDGTSL